MARRDDREPGPPPRVVCAVGWQYREYLREEQRRQPRGPQRGGRVGVEEGCPAREVVLDQRGQATTRDTLPWALRVPFIDVAGSPLAPGVSPVRLHYRDAGVGPPIVFLHSGWGYEIYPFDRQLPAFAPRHRIVCPDRSGYGRSTAIESLPPDFHLRAADETRTLIDALGLERPIVWGHSDGAIIALLLALGTSQIVAGVIAEATHFYKRKPQSRAFFESMRHDPRSLGDTVTTVLTGDHGERWPEVIERHSRAWQHIAEEAASDTEDFYGGRLGEIAVPALVLHGARDPRTEPGELDAMRSALVGADPRVGPGRTPGSAPTIEIAILPDGGHSPHSEAATVGDVGQIALAFIDGVGP